jgi:hypothetical protein
VPAVDFIAVALGEIVFAILSIIGLLLVDSELHRVNWSAAGTWVWIGMFIAILAAGLINLILARRANASA